MEFLGKHKESELKLMHENLKNIDGLVNYAKSIFTFDRSYVGMELYARIIELGGYFVVKIRKSDYKDEKEQIKSKDSPIKLELDGDRLSRFKDPILKEKYSKKLWLNLRIVDIELPTGEIETVLTNIPSENHDCR